MVSRGRLKPLVAAAPRAANNTYLTTYTPSENEIYVLTSTVTEMRKIAYQLKESCNHTKTGVYSSHASRLRRNSIIARDIEACGFRNLNIENLKPKHVEALVAYWKERKLSVGTIKNLMTDLRRWAKYIGKDNLVKRTNAEYGIENRVHVTNESKSTEIANDQLARVTDPYTKMALRLQQAFGVRREESLKIRPSWGYLGDRIRLKASWTKGGRYRAFEICTEEQRMVLNEAKALAGKGSLVPKGMRYKDQLERFKAQCDKAGISHVHGLRHCYVQQRYEALTGWKAPACGGPTSKQLTPEQKALDRKVRLILSEAIGHHRENVTAIYLGR